MGEKVTRLNPTCSANKDDSSIQPTSFPGETNDMIESMMADKLQPLNGACCEAVFSNYVSKVKNELWVTGKEWLLLCNNLLKWCIIYFINLTLADKLQSI